MAEAAFGFLKDEIARLIRSPQDTMSGVQGELQILMDEVRLVNSYLGNTAGMLQPEQLREMDLERQMKEVVYDVEDAVEYSMIQMAAAKAKNILHRKIMIAELGYEFERMIKSIRSSRLEPITRRIQAYGDLGIEQTHSTETNRVLPKQSSKEVPAIKFVGFEDEATTLISSLLEETEELDVVAITGMPGIGKTTLASKIYLDERIRDKFSTRIWVDDDFRSKDLWLNNLKQVIKKGMINGNQELVMSLDIPRESCSKNSCPEILNESSKNDDKLIDAARDYRKKSMFLLVMDAVWDAESLRSVLDVLPKTGKVLVTSRNNRITMKPHVLRFMNEKESWELLQLEVFGQIEECSDMLKTTGEIIAQKCDGLPLAIAVVGSSLVVASEDLTEKLWKAVSENVTQYVTDYGAQHNVFERVELSYVKLPQHLQECFLYLGVFPPGHEIPVRTLAHLWIAEGLVQDTRRLILSKSAEQILREIKEGSLDEIELQILEETADKYLHHLIDTNLVMVGNGLIKTCRLHKLIYGFCKYKAAEKDLYQEIKMYGDRPISLTPNCHRLCIYSNLSKFLSSKPKGRRVRSLLYLNNQGQAVLHPEHSFTIYECFKLLRVLECRFVNFTRFPNQLSALIHLRYISLSCDEICVIPKTISSLCYLETLVVHTESSYLQLKANIWKMFQLRHLVTKAAIVLAIKGKGEAGKNLQTLTRLAPESCTEDVLRRAPNLKTLGIRGHLATLSDANSLRTLQRLEYLKLINESAADCRLHLDCFPPNLKRLTLSGTCLGWECMSILGKIEGLEILKLKNNAFIGASWSSMDAECFCRLGFLLIGTSDLVSWEVSPDCFPNLKCLVLKNCEKLQKVPSALAKSLDTLDVENVSESAAESAMEIEQEIARRQGKR